MMKYFGGEAVPDTKEGVYQYYKDRDLMAVILVTGPVSEDGAPTHNDWSAELQNDYPEQFIGFGGVDPKQGKLAVKEAVR